MMYFPELYGCDAHVKVLASNNTCLQHSAWAIALVYMAPMRQRVPVNTCRWLYTTWRPTATRGFKPSHRHFHR
jgi:hypothetical protein